MNSEKINIERGLFVEVMSNILHKLEIGEIFSANDFMLGMKTCFEMTTIDFKFTYDYLVDFLIRVAPELTKDGYLDLSQTIFRMASYMHRFHIINAKLTPLNEIAEKQLNKCKDQ